MPGTSRIGGNSSHFCVLPEWTKGVSRSRSWSRKISRSRRKKRTRTRTRKIMNLNRRKSRKSMPVVLFMTQKS